MTYNVFGGTLNLTQSINQSVGKEELCKFWKSSTSGFGYKNVSKDSSTLRGRRTFFTVRLVSLEIVIGSS